MQFLNKIDDQWAPLQAKVFSRWVALQLDGKTNTKVEDITKDLGNGVALCELATILTKKTPNRNWVREPTRTVDMVQNCELAIKMFENDGVHFVGISGKDINDNKEKLILGLVWTLILHYSVSKSVQEDEKELLENSAKINANDREAIKSGKKDTDVLMNWATDRTANYPNLDKNFQPYNLAMCALLDTYVPEKIKYDKIDPSNSEHNSELATNVMKDLGIPVLVYPQEIEDNHNQVDEKSLLTQLSSAKFVLDKSFHGVKTSSFLNLNQSSQANSSAEQLSDTGNTRRIPLTAMRDSNENNAEQAKKDAAPGEHSSNLIDLNSIPTNLTNKNGNAPTHKEVESIHDFRDIPVPPKDKMKAGENGKEAVSANGGVVESSSEIESTSEGDSSYSESDDGDNAHKNSSNADGHNGVAGVNGVSGAAVGPDGKPVSGTGANRLTAGLNGASGVNGVVGPDGKDVNGTGASGLSTGTGANGAAGHNGVAGVNGVVGHDGKVVNGTGANGFGVNGTHGNGANGLNNGAASGIAGATGVNGVSGLVGPDGKPLSGANGTGTHGLTAGTKGFGADGAHHDGFNSGLVGPGGKPVSAVNGTGVNGLGSVNGSNGVVGPDGKPANGTGANGLTAGLNGASGVHTVVGPDGKPVSGVNGIGANGLTAGTKGFGADGAHHNGVNNRLVGPDGKPLSGVNGTGVNGFGAGGHNGAASGVNGVNSGLVGPDGKPVSGVDGTGAHGLVSGVTGANGVSGLAGPDGKPLSGVNGSGINGTDANGFSTKAGAVNGNGASAFGHNGTASTASGVSGAAGPYGKPLNGTGVNGMGATGAHGDAVNGLSNGHSGVAGTTGVNGVSGVVGPHGKPVSGTGANGLTNAHNGTSGINGVVGPDGKPVSGIGATGFRANGAHGVAGSTGVNGVSGAVGPDGKPVSGKGANGLTAGLNGASGVHAVVGPDGKVINGTGASGLSTGTGANGAAGHNGVAGVNGVVGHDGKVVNRTGANGIGVNGTHGNGSNGLNNGAATGLNGVSGVVGPDGKPVSGVSERSVGPNGEVLGISTNRTTPADALRDAGLLTGGEKNMKVLTPEDKVLTRKMSIRHIKLLKPGDKNIYNAALPWYVSISGKRGYANPTRSQKFCNEDTLLTRRMSLPHFRFINEIDPKELAEHTKDDTEVNSSVKPQEKAIESIEIGSDDEVLKEQAKNSIIQSPEDKVLTKDMSIRHIKLLRDGEKNYYEKNLQWYVSISGKNRGAHDETKNVTRDFKINPEDVCLTRKMSLPHFRYPDNDTKVLAQRKVDAEKKAVEDAAAKKEEEERIRNDPVRLANEAQDKELAEKAIKMNPEDKFLTRNMSIRHIKTLPDGERNYFDNTLPWYISISGNKRGSPEETKNVTRDFEIEPEDVVLTRKMDLPHYKDPKTDQKILAQKREEAKKAAAEQKEREAKELAAEEEEERLHPHPKGVELTPEDKVLTRKMSIRHIKLLKPGEKNYYEKKLPWYVSISGKRRGSADECRANTRTAKFNCEDAVLTRHMSLPSFAPPKSEHEQEVQPDNAVDEKAGCDEVQNRDISIEEEPVLVTPEQKAKEFNLEDKVLTRKMSLRHIKILKNGEKNYKEPGLKWYVSCSGKRRNSTNEQKAVTRDVQFDQEDRVLTRKLHLPQYVRPKCNEEGANNNYTACHMFDVKKQWW